MGLRDYMAPRWIWELPDLDREKALWEHWKDSGRPRPEGRIPWMPVDTAEEPTTEELERVRSLPAPPFRMVVPKGEVLMTPPAEAEVQECEKSIGDILEKYGSWVLYEAMAQTFRGETLEFREALMQRMWNLSEEKKYEHMMKRKQRLKALYEGEQPGKD